MAVFVGLLYAVNVGGTGKLAMKDLVALCESAGFANAKTYIASGNVVFESKLPEPKAKTKLERALTEHMGKPIKVALRSAAELEAALAHNPFKKQPPNRVLVLFANDAYPKSVLKGVEGPDGEELAVKGRELFIHYPSGLGRSKLKVPLVKEATGRNLNTVTKLAAMARALEG